MARTTYIRSVNDDVRSVLDQHPTPLVGS